MYRDPIVRWMRLDGLEPQDAEDAADDFLSRWLNGGGLHRFVRGERRFRDFLGVCLQNFLTERHQHATRQKRGGGASHVPLDEVCLAAQSIHPAARLDYLLARDLQKQVLSRLSEKWAQKLPVAAYPSVFSAAFEGDSPRYSELSAKFGASVNNVKQWVFRLRKDYGHFFHEAVRDWVDCREDVAEVERYFHELLASPPSR